jgi:branched-chain amino acid transport system permease protein
MRDRHFWLALLARLAASRCSARDPDHDAAPLLGRDPLTTILATFGVSLVLQNYALWQFGRWRARSRSPSPATSRSSTSITLVPARRSRSCRRDHRRALLFLKYGTYGIWIRATTQDRVMAQPMGIPVPLVHTAVFAIGAGMAAASGVLFGPAGRRQPRDGLDWSLKAFIVVVVGGMGNLGGSILAVDLHQPARAYASLWVSPAQAVIVSFVVLILTLLFRPPASSSDTEMSSARADRVLDRLRVVLGC